jgi:hypothetical protein
LRAGLIGAALNKRVTGFEQQERAKHANIYPLCTQFDTIARM